MDVFALYHLPIYDLPLTIAMALAYIFPGQGSQHPGMGKDLAENFPAARQVFEEADEALEFSNLAFVF